MPQTHTERGHRGWGKGRRKGRGVRFSPLYRVTYLLLSSGMALETILTPAEDGSLQGKAQETQLGIEHECSGEMPLLL